MSVFTKMLIVLVLFVVLNVYTIYNFDYTRYFEVDKIDFKEESDSFKDYLNNKFLAKGFRKEASFFIEKRESLLVLNGSFSSEASVKRIMDFLQINLKGDIEFSKDIKTNENLVEELFKLINPLKDFFYDGASIIKNDDKFILEGTLLDEDYRSIISKIVSTIPYRIELKVFDE